MRSVVLVLLALAVGLGLWMWFSEEPDSTPERPSVPTRDPYPEADPVPVVGGFIHGKVLREGIAVPARVDLHRVTAPETPDPIAELMGTRRELVATTEAKESFEFRGLESGRYRLQATAPGGALAVADVVLTDSVRDAEVELSIPGGSATLTVRAIYADDRPFAGLLTVVPWSREREDLFGGASVSID